MKFTPTRYRQRSEATHHYTFLTNCHPEESRLSRDDVRITSTYPISLLLLSFFIPYTFLLLTHGPITEWPDSYYKLKVMYKWE
jgi:hypothetical protein